MTEHEREMVERLRALVAMEYGALAIIRELGHWFPDFLEEYDREE
jgi:hypothetical protein